MPNAFSELIHLARSGMLARLFDLDVAGHNLANVNTTGFKASRTNFQEVLSAASAPNGTQPRATQHLMGPGSTRVTGQPLDMAIEGEGFFAVTLPDGRVAYTRDGQFTKGADNRIVSSAGYPLVWEGALPPAAEDVHVNPDGSVMARIGDAWTPAGQIQITRFPNPSGLTGYGQNLWLETEASGAAVTGAPNSNALGRLLGRTLESSNVNMAQEMTHMVTLQRAYSLSVRAFQQTDEMMAQALQMRR